MPETSGQAAGLVRGFLRQEIALTITVVQTAGGNSGSAQQTSLSATFPQPTTTGNCVVVCIATRNATSGTPWSKAALGGDSSGFIVAGETYAGAGSTFCRADIQYYPACPGGQTSVSVTTSVAENIGFMAYEVSGLTSTPLDQTSSSEGTSTSWTSGTTPATTLASEIVFGSAALDGSLGTSPSGYTNSAVNTGVTGYKTASTAGTFSYAGTQSSSSGYAGVVATFGYMPIVVEWDVAGDYTWTSPIDGTALIEAKGAGAGGNGSSADRGAPGAGSGEYAAEPDFRLTKNQVYNLTVGAGGQGGTSGVGGSDGEDSFFDPDNVPVYANGGLANGGAWIGGPGGTGSTNTIHFNGGSGYTVPTGQTSGGGSGGSAGSQGAGGNAPNINGGTAGAGGGSAGATGGTSNHSGASGSGAGVGGAGAGAAAASTTSKAVQYQAIDSRSYYGSDATGSPNGTRYSNGTMWQGGTTASGGSYNGTQKSIFWFDKAKIQSDFSGYTFTSVVLWVTNLTCWYGSGATIELQDYNSNTIPGSWNGSSNANVHSWSLKTGVGARPGWTLGTSTGDHFLTGSQWGFAIGPGSGSYNLNFYASFNGTPNSANGPVLVLSGDKSTTPAVKGGDGADGMVRITYFETSPVTVSAGVKWNTRKKISPTAGVTWNTKTTIGRQYSTAWNTRKTISPFKAVKWNTLQTIKPPGRQVAWVTIGRIGALGRTAWNTSRTLGTTGILAWNTRQPATTSMHIAWVTPVRATPYPTRGVSWKTYAQLKLLNQQRWNTEQTRPATRLVTWNTQGVVIAAHVTVGSPVRWNTNASLSTYSLVTWNTNDIHVSVMGNVAWNTNSYVHVSVTRAVEWTTVGRIALTPPVRWNSLVTKPATAPVSWKSLAQAYARRSLSWKNLGRFPATRALRWNTSKSMMVQRAVMWEDAARIHAQGSLRWNTWATFARLAGIYWNTQSQLIQIPRAVKWGTAGLVSTQRHLAWAIYQQQGKAALSRWSVKKAIFSRKPVRWNTLHSVKVVRTGDAYNSGGYGDGIYGGTPGISWRDRKRISATGVTAWKTLNSVSPRRKIAWKTRKTIRPSASVRWNNLPVPVYYHVSAARSIKWNTVPPTPVTVLRQAAWKTRSRIKSTRRVSWTTEALTPVSVALRVAWGTSSRTKARRTLKWNDLKPVVTRSGLSWRTLKRISPSSPVAWKDHARVTSKRRTSWKTLRHVSVAASCAWNDAGKTRVSVTRGVEWDTRKRASTQRPVTWYTLKHVALPESCAWKTAGRIPVQRSVRWNSGGHWIIARHIGWKTHAYTVTSATVKWKVGQPVPTYIPVAGRVPWQEAQ